MIISDQQREENFQEYLRLLQDPNYTDVTFDEKSGGVSAVHLDHQFDKSIGPFGYKRGEYELNSVAILRRRGHYIVLESELSSGAVVCKNFDGYLDGSRVEIKTVESDGRWAVMTKIIKAKKQGAQMIILYFPQRELYSLRRVTQGLEDISTSSREDYEVAGWFPEILSYDNRSATPLPIILSISYSAKIHKKIESQ